MLKIVKWFLPRILRCTESADRKDQQGVPFHNPVGDKAHHLLTLHIPPPQSATGVGIVLFLKFWNAEFRRLESFRTQQGMVEYIQYSGRKQIFVRLTETYNIVENILSISHESWSIETPTRDH